MSSNLRRFRLQNARRLRSNATHIEQQLWRAFRAFPVYGTHFRRQVAIGPYVVDFACQRARLIIEVDGSQHGEDREMKRDAIRTRWLESEGYTVLRFWNSEVTGNLDGVLERIYSELYGSTASEPKLFDHPTPARSARRPSPSRGG